MNVQRIDAFVTINCFNFFQTIWAHFLKKKSLFLYFLLIFDYQLYLFIFYINR